jgi:hypothetical protein
MYEQFAAAPWATRDVGAVAQAGSLVRTGAAFTVNGSGADIYGTADGFRYVYQTATGDVTITARVASIQNVNVWSKAGVMMRDGLAPGAVNVMALTSPTPSNGYRFQTRVAPGGSSTSVAGGPGTTPVWLRLVRAGSLFSGFYSADGATWTALGAPTSLTMSPTITVGLAVTSHSSAIGRTAGVFDGVTVTSP